MTTLHIALEVLRAISIHSISFELLQYPMCKHSSQPETQEHSQTLEQLFEAYQCLITREGIIRKKSQVGDKANSVKEDDRLSP